jgi:collagenase-like PrtC family protease
MYVVSVLDMGEAGINPKGVNGVVELGSQYNVELAILLALSPLLSEKLSSVLDLWRDSGLWAVIIRDMSMVRVVVKIVMTFPGWTSIGPSCGDLCLVIRGLTC